MKRLHIAIFVVLILSVALFITTVLLRRRAEDTTIPTISCATDELRLSAAADEQSLLEGVTAWDEKDGDLTGEIVVERISGTSEPGTAMVTYAVADRDHHVASCSRTVVYTDYISPRFSLSKPLIYNIGESIQIRDRLQAQDVIDGSLSDRIKINAGNLSAYYEGSYPITIEVTNSLGDTSALTLNVEIQRSTSGTPKIQLKEYLVYLENVSDFHAFDYVNDVTDGDISTVTVSVNGSSLQEGLNQVIYSCTGSNGSVGSTVLYVIVG